MIDLFFCMDKNNGLLLNDKVFTENDKQMALPSYANILELNISGSH